MAKEDQPSGGAQRKLVISSGVYFRGDTPPIVGSVTGRDAAIWIASAFGSGVLGNVSYDLLKAVAFRRRSRLPMTPLGPHQASKIAILAVQARCAELGIRVPPQRASRAVSALPAGSRGGRC